MIAPSRSPPSQVAPCAGPRARADVARLFGAIVEEKLPIVPTCAARTVLADITPALELSQALGAPIEVCMFVGSSPIRSHAEGWELDRLVQVTRDAVAALGEPGARLIAGGTDLLPNLKHRLAAPTTLVSIGRLPLRHVALIDGASRIGAGAVLADVAAHPLVQAHAPSLARAAGVVAGPTLRNLGTLGGNLHLDTRCRYVNQTPLWREAIGGCLKSHGDRCHVVPGGQTCVAALSSDCVPVLIALDASVVLHGASGIRVVALADYYRADGTAHTRGRPDDLATEVRIPVAPGPRREAYVRWTMRRSIDFPLISIALRFDLAEAPPGVPAVAAPVVGARVVVGALASTPRAVKRLDAVLGRPLADPAVAEAVAAAVAAQCKPLPNVPYDADDRRAVLPVHVRRAVAGLVAAG